MDKYKEVLFARYIGQFMQAESEADATMHKSSEDIAFDLSAMAEYYPDEITAKMIEFNYRIGFEDNKPIWLMKEDREKQLKE